MENKGRTDNKQHKLMDKRADWTDDSKAASGIHRPASVKYKAIINAASKKAPMTSAVEGGKESERGYGELSRPEGDEFKSLHEELAETLSPHRLVQLDLIAGQTGRDT